MIRDGSGKMKGRRNHRHRGWPLNRTAFRNWRRGLIYTVFTYNRPLLLQWSAAEDLTSWTVQ